MNCWACSNMFLMLSCSC